MRPYIIIAAVLFFSILVVIFAGRDLSGRVTDTTVLIVNSSPITCLFAAEAGYNIISIPCLSSTMPVENVTAGAQVTALYQYVPGNGDPWRVYNPNLPSYVYIAIMAAPASVPVEGLNASSTEVPLVVGWNLVGYPSFRIQNISSVIAPINSTITNITTYDAGVVSYPGGLLVFEPYLGYWVNSSVVGTMTVNS
jgi:hypothetical protein